MVTASSSRPAAMTAEVAWTPKNVVPMPATDCDQDHHPDLDQPGDRQRGQDERQRHGHGLGGEQ
jgi:hypothetical protein